MVNEFSTDEIINNKTKCITEISVSAFLKKIKKKESISDAVLCIGGIKNDIGIKTEHDILINDTVVLYRNSNICHIGAVIGIVDIVEYFLTNDGNINNGNDHRQTPLHAALFSGKTNVAMYILRTLKKNITDKNFVNVVYSKNALNLVKKDIDGNTPLHCLLLNDIAFANNEKDYNDLIIKMIELYHNVGYDINIQNKNGDTAGHIAARYINNIAFIELLKTGALNLSKPNNKEESILSIIADKKRGTDFDDLMRSLFFFMPNFKSLVNESVNKNKDNILISCVKRNALRSIIAFKKTHKDTFFELMKSKNVNGYSALDYSIYASANCFEEILKDSDCIVARDALINFLKNKYVNKIDAKIDENLIIDRLLSVASLGVLADKSSILHFVAKHKEIPFEISKKIINYFDNEMILSQNNNGSNIFHIALESGNDEFFCNAIKELGDKIYSNQFMAKNNQNLSVVDLIARYNKKNCLIELIKLINISDILDGVFSNKNNTLLHFLIKDSEILACDLLDYIKDKDVECFKKLFLYVDKDKRNVMHIAALKDAANVFKKLHLEKKDMYKELDRYGKNALDLALNNGANKTIDFLFENCLLGLEQELYLKIGEKNNIKTIKKLIQDPRKQEFLIEKHLIYLIKKNKIKDLENIYKNKNFDINKLLPFDDCDKTALHFAVSIKNLNLIKILLKNGANISCVDANGRDSLSFAIENNTDTLILKELLNNSNAILINRNSKIVFTKIIETKDNVLLKNVLDKVDIIQPGSLSLQNIVDIANNFYISKDNFLKCVKSASVDFDVAEFVKKNNIIDKVNKDSCCMPFLYCIVYGKIFGSIKYSFDKKDIYAGMKCLFNSKSDDDLDNINQAQGNDNQNIPAKFLTNANSNKLHNKLNAIQH